MTKQRFVDWLYVFRHKATETPIPGLVSVGIAALLLVLIVWIH